MLEQKRQGENEKRIKLGWKAVTNLGRITMVGNWALSCLARRTAADRISVLGLCMILVSALGVDTHSPANLTTLQEPRFVLETLRRPVLRRRFRGSHVTLAVVVVDSRPRRTSSHWFTPVLRLFARRFAKSWYSVAAVAG